MGSYRFAVITLSDSGARGEREDTSGEALKDLFIDAGYRLCCYRVIPDNVDEIVSSVKLAIDKDGADLVLTTGGTGVSPTDVTPEAMERVFDKEIPGMAEAMRAESLKITPRAVISRSRAGIYKSGLIINLPGSKKAALENIGVLMPALDHALEKIMGSTADCGG